LSQYLDVYDDSDFLDYMDDFYTLHKVDFPVGRYIIYRKNCTHSDSEEIKVKLFNKYLLKTITIPPDLVLR
jgi:hypothetical protein